MGAKKNRGPIQIEHSKWCIITFGSSKRWRGATKRLARQSRKFGFDFYGFDEFTLETFVPGLMSEHAGFIQDSKRGFGYWFWKSHLVHHAVATLEDYQGVIYLDSGCELNFNAVSFQRMSEFIATAEQFGALFFQLPYVESQFVKQAVLDHLQPKSSDLESGQIEATIFFLVRSKGSLQLCEKWKELSCLESHGLINDSNLVGLSNFVDHRHDQSLLSLLVKELSWPAVQPSEFFQGPFWWRSGKSIPIWEARNRYRISVKHRLLYRAYGESRRLAKWILG